MLKITIPAKEFWDETNEKFIHTPETTLQLEHSLVSISKWESKWHKPYLTDKKEYEKTPEEVLDYIRCMTITQNVNPQVYYAITEENAKDIKDYLNDPHTASWFSKDQNNGKHNREIVTSELIYYYMIALQIPVEFQKWHINRLMTLIRICSIKNEPPKKMNRNQLLNRNASLNAARRAAANSKG